MTFSQSVKNEICRSVRNAKSCCATAFLTAVVKSIGSLTLGSGGYAFCLDSDNGELLALCANLAREHLAAESETVSFGTSKGIAYSCRFEATLGEKLGLVTRDDEGMLDFAEARTLLPESPCCRRAFMQGLFASCGSVVIPQTEQVTDNDNARYHLELRFTDPKFAEAVSNIYSQARFRMTPRKSHTVLYLKESELIADFLVYVNATRAKLELENVIITRSVRNDVNRQNNCVVANIEKTVEASARQLRAIGVLRDSGTFDTLPETLRDIAVVRENAPEATLEEIAVRLHISKSGANHRFTKLMELADKQRTK